MAYAAATTEMKWRDLEWSRLMAAAQDGDAKAYESLLGQIQPLIRRIVVPSHRNADRADDVVQDVLLAVHRVRHTYNASLPFSHWLAAIARHRSIDALRRRIRIERSEVSDDTIYASFPDPLASKTLEVRQIGEELNRAIATLPSSQRTALELVKLREVSLAEASVQTGRSIAALKVAVHRAVKALRLHYEGSMRLGAEIGVEAGRDPHGGRMRSRHCGFPEQATYQSSRPQLPTPQSAGSSL